MKKSRKTSSRKTKPAAKSWTKTARGFVSLKYLSILILGIGLLVVAAALIYAARSKPLTFTPLPAISYNREIADTGEIERLINVERKKAGQPALPIDGRLRSVAESRLRNMIASQRYAHQDLSGKYYYDTLASNGYRASYSCENLDIEDEPNAPIFIASWLSSSDHKSCMLHKNVTRLGVASGVFSTNDSLFGKEKTYLVVTIFASDPQATKQ
jgi:uncharacterized protein YkwD